MSTNRNEQNSRYDIPKGRSTSRIKNASKSQGFANKDLYGSSARNGTNGYAAVSSGSYKKTSYRQQRSNGSRDDYQGQLNHRGQRKRRNSEGEMSESTMVKVIVGSILAAVLLAVVIIVALILMDFQL